MTVKTKAPHRRGPDKEVELSYDEFRAEAFRIAGRRLILTEGHGVYGRYLVVRRSPEDLGRSVMSLRDLD
jgi:hypothetical protein